MNSITLIGRLTATPELKTTPNGKSVCNFTVAVQRKFKDAGGEPVTDYIDCVAWGSTAEFISRWFNKGVRIAVQGELQTRLYKDNDGKSHKVCEVLVKETEFADGKTQANETPNTNNSNSTVIPDADAFVVVPDEEDLPFNN